MVNNNEWLIIGEITSPHGIDGKLKVKSLSDFPERFTKPGQRWLQVNMEEPISYELVSGKQKPGTNTFIISLRNIDNRNKAEGLRKHKLLVQSNDMPDLKPGEFHINELKKLKVKEIVNKKENIIGEVCDLLNERNNLLLIKLYSSNKKVLVPFVEEIITCIDLKKGFLIIDPPKGLFDL